MRLNLEDRLTLNIQMCHFNTLQFQKAPGMCIKYTTRVFRLEYKNICRSYSCSNDHLNQAVGSNFRAK